MSTTYFKWNGRSCADYGIFVINEPTIIKPQEKVTFIDVPKRNGALTISENAFNDIMLDVNCGIKDIDKVEEISAYLNGGGQLEFPTMWKDMHFTGRVINSINFDKVMRGRTNRTFTVSFRLNPFLYDNSKTSVRLVNPTTSLMNKGSVDAIPVIRVSGSGDINLMVNGEIINLIGISGVIVIDSVMSEAYDGNRNLINSKMSGEFPMLQTGMNGISWTGNVSSVTVEFDTMYMV